MQQYCIGEEWQAPAADPCMEPFPEFMNPSQGFLNNSNMDHLISQQNNLNNNHHSPEYLAHDLSHGYSQALLHHDSGAMHALLPDKTALFVASYLRQLRVSHGMDMTLDQAIGICGGHVDIPVANPNPVYDQMVMAESFAIISTPSTSYTDSRSGKSETHEQTLRRDPFISTAGPKHEIFRDGNKIKVRCFEGRCEGRELMKGGYNRHVRELHLGEKRRAGSGHRRGVRPKTDGCPNTVIPVEENMLCS